MDAKGGDVDLLILCPEGSVEELKRHKSKILLDIEKQTGEQRIDLTIDSLIQKSSFVNSILSSAVEFN